ncbi:MAG: hypothetical protein ABI053_06315 [Lacisediminihabitans sp.]
MNGVSVGDEFTALTRDDDIIMIDVEQPGDNAFFVPGEYLQLRSRGW